MPIYELTSDALTRANETNLASEGIRERTDLQRLLKANITPVAQDVYVLAEEYREWEDSRRSIDLLGLDKDANLVVIELKRTEDGGHMELQAIRYAAMISKMTFSQAVEAHEKYLNSNGIDEDAESKTLEFLEWDEPQENEFGQHVRIVLVSADFSKEITTSVLWLNEHELDVTCVRLRPYKLGEKTLLDIQQVIPLPEAAEYQVQLRRKAAEERDAKQCSSDWSKFDLVVGEKTIPNLTKRHLFLNAVRALLNSGVAVSELMETIPARKVLGVEGKLSSEEFRREVSKLRNNAGSPYDLRRRFTNDENLFFCGGKTWALSNQWSRHQPPDLDYLITKYPEAKIRYGKSEQEPAKS